VAVAVIVGVLGVLAFLIKRNKTEKTLTENRDLFAAY
jgi:hypothetical protein